MQGDDGGEAAGRDEQRPERHQSPVGKVEHDRCRICVRNFKQKRKEKLGPTTLVKETRFDGFDALLSGILRRLVRRGFVSR